MAGRAKNWQWDHFYKPGHKYKNNNSHFTAKCNYCIHGHLDAVQKEAEEELNLVRSTSTVMPSKQELLELDAAQ